VIDGGNSHYSDTNRRVEKLSTEDLRYVGMGISGGEEGARHGPSLMPGGDEGAWFHIQSPLKSIAAKSADGTPCCHWMGSAGAGHYVKMIHNGIEYATMQLIAECYQLMKDILDMSNALIGSTFDSWNEGLLESYLLEITRDIFAFRNDRRQWVLDIILDKAGQKGTGRWAAMTALELGIPAPVITEAVFARTMSGYKDLREQAAQQFHIKLDRDSRSKIIENLQAAMLGSFLVAFSEGFWLLKAANDEYGWDIPLAEVANAWKAGCIIRSSVLKPIAQAYTDENTLTHLLLAPAFRRLLQSIHRDWRSAICFASEAGSPIPAMSAALAHFDSLRTPKGPANLIQAQRDYFGAHHYERIDKPRGKFFHTDWQKI
jgi:6-phosphogluconate dehydrogenase